MRRIFRKSTLAHKESGEIFAAEFYYTSDRPDTIKAKLTSNMTGKSKIVKLATIMRNYKEI
jgi:hypothetical protein